MGIDRLIERLERDAEARLGELRARTQAEASALLAEAGRLSRRQQLDALAERRRARQEGYERELAEARRAARAARLEAQHALLSRVARRAAQLLETAEEEAGGLERRLDDALQYFEGVPAVVRCRPSVAQRLGPALARHPGLGQAEEGLPPGFVLSALDRSLEVDDTAPARLARAWPALSMGVLAQVAVEGTP